MIVFERRASTILFNLLSDVSKPFLIPANVCPIVPLIFLKANKPFEVVDISSETLCLDEGLVLRKLTEKPDHYAGILFVRTFGVLRSFERFFKGIRAINEKLLIVDDACLCPPRFDRSESTVADVVLYSTGYGKFIDVGGGGYAHCRSGLKYRRMESPFNPQHLTAVTNEYKAAFVEKRPLRYRDCDWLETQAPTLSFDEYRKGVEKAIPAVQEHKQQINNIYKTGLPAAVQLGPDYQGWRFNLLVPDRQQLLAKIFHADLFASSHYDSVTQVIGSGHSSNSDRIASQILNLFNDYHFDATKASRITEIVSEHLASTALPGKVGL
jgi:hypothetical protein